MKGITKQILKSISQEYNINILKYDESFINLSLSERSSANCCCSLDEYFSILKNSEGERKILVDSLQVNYSEFFRNSFTFSVLEKIVLPLLSIRNRNSGKKEIRIWSAACSSGQEAYSIAILMEELKNIHHYNYRIFATDKNEQQITNAAKGCFNYQELNNLTARRIDRWFTKNGDIFLIDPGLRKNIDFSVFDLLDEKLKCPASSIFGNFDLVIYANILFYYGKENQHIILKKTCNCMSENSFLVVDETEREILKNHKFREAFPQSAIFYPHRWSKNDETKKF